MFKQLNNSLIGHCHVSKIFIPRGTGIFVDMPRFEIFLDSKSRIQKNFVDLCNTIIVSEVLLSRLLQDGVINTDEKETVHRRSIISFQQTEELLLLILGRPSSLVEKFIDALRVEHPHAITIIEHNSYAGKCRIIQVILK